MNPVEISEMKIDKTNKKISLVVPDDQLSMAIGRHGQNIRLASKLIGWEIDVTGKESKSKEAIAAASRELGGEPEPARQEEPSNARPISELEGVGPKTEKALIAAGYDTIEKIKALGVEDLVKVDGIGQKTAEKIIKSAKGM